MKFLLQVSESCMQAYFKMPLMKLQPMKVSRISSFAFAKAAVCYLCKRGSCCCKNRSGADGASMFPWNLFVVMHNATSLPIPTLSETRVSEVNRRAVFAFRVIGPEDGEILCLDDHATSVDH